MGALPPRLPVGRDCATSFFGGIDAPGSSIQPQQHVVVATVNWVTTVLVLIFIFARRTETLVAARYQREAPKTLAVEKSEYIENGKSQRYISIRA